MRTMDNFDHAHKGSLMAKDILLSFEIFADNEIDKICSAICHHSDKALHHSSFDEVLKDADVLQHCLYNPLFEVAEHEKVRFHHLKSEFGML